MYVFSTTSYATQISKVNSFGLFTGHHQTYKRTLKYVKETVQFSVKTLRKRCPWDQKDVLETQKMSLRPKSASWILPFKS